ncbi:MAG: hypothetical protein HYV41_03070, partial [Candidatus Magasanikbacteria bacterium]|nr:hypothetical protein [Candidatus Magasanikbacteria bacterium]
MNLLDDLVQKDWYFQGFNGTPTLLYGPAFSMIRNMPDTLGFGYSACIQYFKNDVCYYLYAWDDLYKIRDELLSRFAKDNTYLEYLVTHNE